MEFVNADLIASALSPFVPDRAAFRAGRLMLEQIHLLADRVRRGGHNVPEDVVRRRFNRSLPNLFRLYRPLLDSWAVFDNSTAIPNMVACEKSGVLKIVSSELFALLSHNLEEI